MSGEDVPQRVLPLIGPTAWVIDDVSVVPKDGRMSAGVAPQYCGALGKRANCQVAVGIHAAYGANALLWTAWSERGPAYVLPSGRT